MPVRLYLIVLTFVLVPTASVVSAQPKTGSEAYYQFLLGRHLENAGQVDQAVAAF